MAKKVMNKYWVDGTVEMLDIDQTFDVNDLNEKMQGYCMLHGYIQKLRDSIVSLGAGATTADKLNTITTLNNQLLEGDWYAKKAPRGKSIPVKTVKTNYEKLDAEEQAKADALLEKLGINLE